jgi:hypothetical protein
MREDTVVGDGRSDDGRAGDDKVGAEDVAVADSGGELTVEGGRSVGATLLGAAAPALPDDVCAQPANASISAPAVACHSDMLTGRPS